MKALMKFIKKEIVLWIALALAVLSMFVVKPDSRYLSYVDFRTLAILFCLMAVVAGFKRQGVFELLAEKLLSVAGSVRGMVTVLVLLCFFMSMVITNDVALITFVPFTIAVMGRTEAGIKERWLLKTVGIIFEIEVKAFFTERQCEAETFDYLGTTENGTIIRIEVISWDDELSEKEKVKTVIPFQLAYAISIHKAQGLEYKSVKVVIPSNNAEKITHSIFYTAITRAKEKLKIFWSAETMKSVIESFTTNEIEQRTLPVIRKELHQQGV